MSTEYRDFILGEAVRRGIDRDIVDMAVPTEGGFIEAAREGDFETGNSWWAFQLHYGGVGPGDWQDYRIYGDTAGMGNTFTHKTGWAPGDPRAWKDAARFALDELKRGGWGPWYGPRNIGIVGFLGVDRTFLWGGTPDSEWDYKTGATVVVFNPDFPASIQDDDWSCFPTSCDWALRSCGRAPGHSYVEDYLVTGGVVSRAEGLLDHTGAAFVQWWEKQKANPDWYYVDGFYVNATFPVTFSQVVAEASPVPPYPVLLGLPDWGGPRKGHWTGVRGFRDGVLRLANPATGPTYGQVELDAAGFLARDGGGATLVRVLHPDLAKKGATDLASRLKFRTDEIARLAAEMQKDLEAG